MSGDVDLKVSYGSVEQTAADIERAAGVVQKQLDEIWAAVKAVSGTWEGEAKQMFDAAEQQFKARGTHIHQTLTQIAGKIRTGSMDYQSTDRRASKLFDIGY